MKSKPVPDFSVLKEKITDELGQPRPNKYVQAFDQAVQAKLRELQYCTTDGATDMYSKSCTAIDFATIKVLPKARRGKGIKRKVSKRTRDLYVERTKLADCSAQVKKSHQQKIKDAGMQDFQDWVKECAQALNKANGHGDTSKVYDLVKQMQGKPGKPSKNLSEDEDGNMLKDSKEVATRWFRFLKSKFSATDAELHKRPPMQALPQAATGDTLTEKEALLAIAKLSSGKACGPDGIPAEVFKCVPICQSTLVALLQRIWADEDVPEDFAKAVFVMLFKNKGSPNDP